MPFSSRRPSVATERHRLRITSLVSIGVSFAAWRWLHDATVSLYLGLVAVLVTSVFWRWPKHEWLATPRLRMIHSDLGSRKLSRSYRSADDVMTLSDHLHVKNFFITDWLEECSEKLAIELQDALVKKVIAYVIAFLALLVVTMDSAHEKFTTAQLALKIGASLAVVGLPLLWDYSRWARQRNLNLELRAPDPPSSARTHTPNTPPG